MSACGSQTKRNNFSIYCKQSSKQEPIVQSKWTIFWKDMKFIYVLCVLQFARLFIQFQMIKKEKHFIY